ncbi:MAG: response regulator [Nitrospira sp.]|nr:MAG: response regulator [Nitrospira sp.]
MKTTVLVVEDEQDTAELLKRLLEREGFSVLHAGDGRQARTLIDTIRPPSLVLLDMVIPYVSGFELLRVIRRHSDWQHTPIIMLSADDYEPDIQQALREGATAYVTKQKGSAALLQAVQRLLPATPPQGQIVAQAGSAAPPTQRVSVRHRLRGNQRKKPAA